MYYNSKDEYEWFVKFCKLRNKPIYTLNSDDLATIANGYAHFEIHKDIKANVRHVLIGDKYFATYINLCEQYEQFAKNGVLTFMDASTFDYMWEYSLRMERKGSSSKKKSSPEKSPYIKIKVKKRFSNSNPRPIGQVIISEMYHIFIDGKQEDVHHRFDPQDNKNITLLSKEDHRKRHRNRKPVRADILNIMQTDMGIDDDTFKIYIKNLNFLAKLFSQCNGVKVSLDLTKNIGFMSFVDILKYVDIR